jgi:hypothetical protein
MVLHQLILYIMAKVGPIPVALFFLTLFGLLIYGLLLVQRNEKNPRALLLFIGMIFFPFLGPLTYILYYHLVKKHVTKTT